VIFPPTFTVTLAGENAYDLIFTLAAATAGPAADAAAGVEDVVGVVGVAYGFDDVFLLLDPHPATRTTAAAVARSGRVRRIGVIW
jgi:hypothetical protein